MITNTIIEFIENGLEGILNEKEYLTDEQVLEQLQSGKEVTARFLVDGEEITAIITLHEINVSNQVDAYWLEVDSEGLEVHVTCVGGDYK